MQTQQRYYTPEEYLKLEKAAEYKSEYLDGQIVPMAGSSTNHNRIALNLSAAMNFAFRQQNYEVFMGDVRLWIPEKRFYTYPDVMAIAGEPEYYNNRTDTVTNPQVIVEVLSELTQGYDREENCAYRTIASFQEYLLVDQNSIHIDHFSQTGKNVGNCASTIEKIKH
ncbi:Uma2 family endonuclease [Gloeocapsopsis crepidinum]|uniref:Uma2 family endonuclease n=1 Tax=Gloeocapsopsis crepidinum TaxID=693223 RepID=UPI002AD53C5A|nr:Uma2 family endonuclease [Gloeocapsopsis crepidinum]